MFNPWFYIQFIVYLCKYICIFMQYVMVNRKLFGIFGFSCMFAKTSYLITLRFFRSLHILRNQQKTKTETKKPRFCRFCRNTSVFVANKRLIFSNLYLYRVIYTPPPVFGTRRVGQLSSEIFYFFIFYFFVKYSDFTNSAFLPNFEHF